MVSIHAPTRGATLPKGIGSPALKVSIHAPTRGATDKLCPEELGKSFQSTHPHGVRRIIRMGRVYSNHVSIHAPTRGATVCKVTYYKSIN